MLVLTLRDSFAALFQKRAPARRERKKIGISFWELFLCACGFKEKVDKRQAVVVSGTIFRYQNSLAAFLWLKSRPLSCLTYVGHLLTQNRKRKANKRNAVFPPTRRAPPLKRWTKQQMGLCEHSARQIKI